jgi:hypothetical protein
VKPCFDMHASTAHHQRFREALPFYERIGAIEKRAKMTRIDRQHLVVLTSASSGCRAR